MHRGTLARRRAALLEALGPEGSAIYAHRAEAAVRLASVRLVQGRVEEAAELLRPFEDRSSSCEVLARAHVARGELDLAEAVARRGLDATSGDCLRLGALRSTLVEIALARDDIQDAASHAQSLDELATTTSAKTAEHHVGRVLSKLGARSRAEAAAVATAATLLAESGPERR